MASATSRNLSTLKIKNLRGGRNGADPPDSLPDIQCVEARNIEWYRATAGRKRGGCDNVALTGGTTFTGKVSWLFRHIPGANEGAAELWGIDDAGTPLVKRLTGGTSWADISLDDAISGSAQEIQAVSFNGKMFIAYDSAVNRLHVWDPAVSKIRRTGLAQAPVPTTGSPSSGSVTDTRTYKVAWTVQVGGATVRRSELSNATAPVALSSQQVVITRGTAPGEGETHWELYTATTDGLYYLTATTAIGTTTATDNNPLISALTPDPVVGINTVFPSVKYLSTDGNRILGAGAWETGGFNSRVWYSPVLGDNDVGDDERYVSSLDQQNFVDLNENDGGYITALSFPIQGSIYVFKYRQIHKLTPTGDIDAPYIPYEVSRLVGCVSQRSLRIGEDQTGRPCLYFMSAQGPYRLGVNGLEYLGMDLEDIMETVNYEATFTVAHSIYYPAKKQWILWLATGSSNDPDTIVVLNTRVGTATGEGVRGGWATYDGDYAAVRTSTLFANVIGSTMSKSLKPYVGRLANNSVLKGDTSTTTDNGTAFRGYITTKTYAAAGDGNKFVADVYPTLVAAAASGVTITVQVSRDYGAEVKSATVDLTAAGSETRVRRKAEGCTLGGCQVASWTFGDATAVASAWTIDALIQPYSEQEAA